MAWPPSGDQKVGQEANSAGTFDLRARRCLRARSMTPEDNLGNLFVSGELSGPEASDHQGFRADSERGIILPAYRKDVCLPLREEREVGDVREDIFGPADYMDVFHDLSHFVLLLIAIFCTSAHPSSKSESSSCERRSGSARMSISETNIERVVFAVLALTLLIAGCSLAVTGGGSVVERKRFFTLLRVSGAAASTLRRVVLLEALLPLFAASVVAAVVGVAVARPLVAALLPRYAHVAFPVRPTT